MKILFLSPILPWPLVSGGQIRAYHLLEALHQNHEITLVAYIRDEKERQYLPELKAICRQVHFIKRQYKPWTWQALLKTLFSTKPLVMNLYETAEPLINNPKEYEAVYCECFYLMDKISKSSTNIFLSEQNIEYLVYQRYIDALSFWKKLIFWLPMEIDILKMKFWEIKMWQRAYKVAVMSKMDKLIIEKKTGRFDIAIIPNGVDIASFRVPTKINTTKNVLFVGNFSWFQNLQALAWLIKEIFPAVRKIIPDAKLLIIGRQAPHWLKDCRHERVILDEKVVDIRDIYPKTAVLLAPLKSGGGTKYKILEAMASGIPVVTTPIGAEGLDGDCMIVKEETKELVEATVDILNQPKKYEEMVKKARRLVEENYDWEIIGEKLEKFLKP